MSTVQVSTVMIERPISYGNTTEYGIGKIIIPNVPNEIGGGSGQSVTVTVDVSEDNLPSDGDYIVHVTPSQPCTAYVTAKTAGSFNVVLTPLSGTLAVGTFDCTVTWQRG
jgi:hypothetical protein